MAASLCNRKRPCGGADLLLHREAHSQPPALKRRFREEKEERRRTAGGCKENRDPGDVLLRNVKTRREPRRSYQPGSGFRSASEVQSVRAEVRLAVIRKTKIPVRTKEVKLVQHQIDPGSSETQLDKRRSTQTKSKSEVRTRSRSTERLRRTGSPVSGQSRTRMKRFETIPGPETYIGEGDVLRTSTRSEGVPKTRRRTKIHPSEFRGRGQLRLLVVPEEGQLIIHVREARGLMGKSHRSCDSYVKLAVNSDLDRSITMTTPTVVNNKNPQYQQKFILCVSDDLVPNRLLFSVFSRCHHLIGCMSFGIKSLISSSKLVSGWFYLLKEEIGRRKHLRVKSQRNKPIRGVKDEDAENVIPPFDLRKTPDSTPDTDLNNIATITTAITTKLSNSTSTTTAGLKDLTNHSLQNLKPTNVNYSSYVSTLYANTNHRQATRNSGSTQRLMVNIVRGKDGFGFTICSDCPVRVQAVDSGGPAHQSGLRQGDSVLQLNGLPVETWKCADLAHAIRSCASQIMLVVWRGLPELRSGCEALLRPPAQNTATNRKLLPHPTRSKRDRRRGQRSGVRSSLGALGSLWRDRKEEEDEEEEEEQEFSPHTTTLKGTRVTSSHGDNYIILSPVNTGGQLLQPVFQDRNGTIGRLYQTHPSRGHNLLQDLRPGSPPLPFPGHTATLPPHTSTSSSSAPPSNYGNYQNCTIVQSHLPCSSYGTYVSLAPKTLIFPIFVQPLDLCSPDRTLLMAEEMVLHQTDLLPAKVTVLIYTDLLLFTREDETGRCHVLQSPLYLNALQLREVASEPLLLHLLQCSQSGWRCLFSLESFTMEQKVRVSLCLHDNIHLQLVATETRHAHQLSDIPSDFGLLSLREADLLYCPSSPFSSSDPPQLSPSSPYSSFCDPLRPPSPSPFTRSSPSSSTTPPPPPFSSVSPYTSSSSSPPTRNFSIPPQLLPPPPSSSSTTQKSPVWKERGRVDEDEEERKKRRRDEMVEERQQGEGESASETSENVGGVGGRGLQLSPHHFNMMEEEEEESDDDNDDEEGGRSEELTVAYRAEGLRRSLSEGSLLQQPRSPRFLSDSTIHRLTCPTNSDRVPTPRRPSIHTLKKQLTREGGSLHQMLLLLNGAKDGDFRNLELRKKTKTLAADVRNRLPFLRRWKNSTAVHGNSLEKALRNTRPSTKEVLRWAESLEALLNNKYGLAVFRHFLRSEFSEENLDFWLAVERFKGTHPLSKMATKAAKIYDEFISASAARQVNVDSSVRETTNQSLHFDVNPASFQLAQDQIFSLMETDSYPRFLRSRLYAQLANQGTHTAAESAGSG
ncbi:regulator of G-protein signaling 3 isoform X2 [Antennarius striatus]|uniref:regulator of G-protein signaling 3 isoform X2 n=1 Tax=Antennarius striatus TaxID=241820 RepID=UPI0035B0FA39